MWCAICRAAAHVGPDLMPRLQHISAIYRDPKYGEVPQKARNCGRSPGVQQGVVARLLRAATGVGDLDASAARRQVRARVPDAEPEDLVLFDDLLGIANPQAKPPKIDPDARRRRLTALVNAMSLARTEPAVFVIEDAHWIDEVSESLLAGFLTVIPQTPSLVLVTYRPEYRGALTRVTAAHTVALAPLSDSETAALVSQLLGHDPSAGVLGQRIAERAAGNPFSPRRWCATWPSEAYCVASRAHTCRRQRLAR